MMCIQFDKQLTVGLDVPSGYLRYTPVIVWKIGKVDNLKLQI